MAKQEAPANFLVVSGASRVGTQRWYGEVIVGPDAIYIFQTGRARPRKYMVLFDLLADRIIPKVGLSGDSYDNIPLSLRTHPRWPIPGSCSSPVLIVPRTSIEVLHHETMRYEVRFKFSGVEIAIPHHEFNGKKIQTFLRSTGWPLAWNGDYFNLPHDSPIVLGSVGFGFRQPHLSIAMIASGIVLGCLPMPLMMFRNMDKDVVGILYFGGLGIGSCLFALGYIAYWRGL